MNAKIKPFQITIAMVRTQSNNLNTINEILNVLENFSFSAPTHFGKNESGGLAYNRNQLLEMIKNGNIIYNFLVFRRNKEPRYESSIDINDSPFITIEFKPTTAIKYWPKIFDLAHELVQVFKPNMAAVHIWHDWILDRSINGINKDNIDLGLMAECAYIVPVSYWKQGPVGLAMRTYFGPHYIKQIGAKFLEDTPAIVKNVFDDTIQINLTEEAWLLDTQSLLSNWRKAMEHIRKSTVFATYKIKPSGSVNYTKGTTCEIWEKIDEKDEKKEVTKEINKKQHKINKLCEQIELSSHSNKPVLDINISKLNIPLASFEECNLECLKADKAILHGASFTEGVLIDCDFIKADLQVANFSEASLFESNFTDANLEGSNWEDAKIDICYFTGANLKKAKLGGAKMHNCDFQGADLSYADLSGGDFKNSDFRGANLKGANTKGAKFKGAYFDK